MALQALTKARGIEPRDDSADEVLGGVSEQRVLVRLWSPSAVERESFVGHASLAQVVCRTHAWRLHHH